jgi:hypothetical protein
MLFCQRLPRMKFLQGFPAGSQQLHQGLFRMGRVCLPHSCDPVTLDLAIGSYEFSLEVKWALHSLLGQFAEFKLDMYEGEVDFLHFPRTHSNFHEYHAFYSPSGEMLR